MDPIKDAFTRAKQDIEELRYQMTVLLEEIENIKRTLQPPTYQEYQPSNQQIIPTHHSNPTQDLPLEAVKTPISTFSSGNRGVPTDRQTNQQTDRHILPSTKSTLEVPINPTLARLEHISEVLSTLDDVKKDLRTQFKRLTNQEMLVFSTIYQFNEENIQADYPSVAHRLGLSETSIRDYVFKIIKKGVPLVKEKQDNKKITLKIPSELTKLASLNTIIQLREI